MRIVLESAGHRTVLAADADQAAERLAPPPDLVIVDVGMAIGDGWAVLAAAARLKVPVVVVSSRATPTQLKRAEEMGAATHLDKQAISVSLASLVERMA